MINKELRKELHKIALDNKVSDTVAEMIIMSPFLFQKRKLEEGDLEGITSFYHKYLCKFFIKKNVLNKIKEKNEFRK